MRDRWFSRLVLLLTGVLTATPVFAHDPPLGTGVFQHAGRYLVRTNRGLLLDVSQHEGESDYRLLCNEALGIDVYETPSIALRADGRWLVGTSQGLSVLSADACTLTPLPPLAATGVSALQQDPFDAAQLWAASGAGLYGSADTGLSFTELAEPVFGELLASPAVPKLLYATGNDGQVSARSVYFARAADAEHFETFAFDLGDNEYGIDLLGAHPTQGDVVFAAAHAYIGTHFLDRFLISHDGARTWDTSLSAPVIAGLAFGEGAVMWLGATDGLRRSTDQAQTWTLQHEDPVSCVVRDGSRLIVCDGAAAEGGVSVSDDEGATFGSILRFRQVNARLDCAPSDMVARMCQVPWSDWQKEIPFLRDEPAQSSMAVLDAGTPLADAAVVMVEQDAGTGEELGDVTRTESGAGGCSMTRSRAGRAGHPLVLFAASWVLIRARRKSRRRAS